MKLFEVFDEPTLGVDPLTLYRKSLVGSIVFLGRVFKLYDMVDHATSAQEKQSLISKINRSDDSFSSQSKKRKEIAAKCIERPSQAYLELQKQMGKEEYKDETTELDDLNVAIAMLDKGEHPEAIEAYLDGIGEVRRSF